MIAVLVPQRLLPPILAIVTGLVLLGMAALPSHAAPKVVSTSGAAIQLEVSKGRLIHLDKPAASVFVADPEVADIQVKSPSLVYLFGKAAGETSLYAVGEDDEVLMNSSVVVRHNIIRLEQAIHQLAPRSAVSVSSIDDNLVLEGTVFSASDGEDIRRVAARFVPDPKQLVNKMRVVAPNQVNIRIRIAEMSRSVVKQFGINWDAAFNVGSFAFGLFTGRTFLDAAGNVLRTTPAGAAGQAASTIGAVRTSNADVNALIDALDEQGLITVLAEPNLSAVSGEPASFLAGGEFPFPVAQQNNVITIEFKKFGVSLNFVATITGGDRINLHVAPEVSQLDPSHQINSGGVSVPGLTTRRAETTLELGSGQSFALAGLMQNNITQNLDKYPWLGDVPILGTLFRSNAFQKSESELVIICTPYIVRPVSTANRLAAPTDGYVSSSDASQVLNGTLNRPQYLKQGAAPVSRTGTGLIGPAGFDLE
jgi:pilus assembly protein CpaC